MIKNLFGDLDAEGRFTRMARHRAFAGSGQQYLAVFRPVGLAVMDLPVMFTWCQLVVEEYERW